MALPRPTAAFVVKVAAAHTVTYLVVGMAASATWDYARILSQPVISDYMLPFGSVNVFVAGLAQLVRGVVLALVLLPFRAVLGSRRGWLWLWALLVGIGIIGTYAAAPSSVEGVVYSRIPLWYHLMGLPEVVVQALLFSILTAWFARYPEHTVQHLPPTARRAVQALVVTCLSFAGYAVVSVVFALSQGVRIDDSANFSLATQGVFVFPLAVNAVLAFATTRGVSPGARAYVAAISYLLGAAGILVYQSVTFGDAGGGYALIAPVLPALILWALTPRATHAGTPGSAGTSAEGGTAAVAGTSAAADTSATTDASAVADTSAVTGTSATTDASADAGTSAVPEVRDRQRTAEPADRTGESRRPR